MAAFEKWKWTQQFCSRSDDVQAQVREAYQRPPARQRARPMKAKQILPPILSIKCAADLPPELTVRQAADALGFACTEPVYERIYAGLLYAQKDGRNWKIPLWSIVQYRANRKANVG